MRLAILCSSDAGRLNEAQEFGFDAIQLRVGPEYPIDPVTGSLDQAHDAARELKRRGLAVAGLGCYRNVLDPDPQVREADRARIRTTIRMAAEVFHAPVVSVFAGRHPELTIEENIPLFRDAWEPLADQASAAGVRLAFENCTMFRGYPLRGINMSHSPHAYRLIFEALPHPSLGIEFDPSHCVKQRIGISPFLDEFRGRLLSFHAKDHERLPEMEQSHGCFDLRCSRDRYPGRGSIDFVAVFRQLGEIGYTGAIVMEAERDPDAVDPETERRLKRGSAAYLRECLGKAAAKTLP